MMIDAHQHFWNPARGDYDWMPMDNAILARAYGPAELTPHLKHHGIHATVLVQAAATINETEYMLGLADATPYVAGVVGWIDFEKPDDLAQLRRLAEHPKFVGVRPMIQDIPDDDWMLRADIQWAFAAVCELDITFDALGFPRHLANFHTLFTRYPSMRVVIDHCMKPQIRDHTEDNFSFWADGMAKIASDTTAFCKYSALVTEAKEGWTADDLRPYVDHVFNAFGPERMIWGSDWPVSRLARGYDDWREAALNLTEHLSEAEKAAVYGGNAKSFYRLEV
ncbi:MAG: amidohydrolase family protein [Hyphomicrobiales bacterium]|jgi:L-fuconolactonase